MNDNECTGTMDTNAVAELRLSPAIPQPSLPTLLERAGQRLLLAVTSAEVLEAKRLAEAALHYAKVTKAANETHADCLRIITRAEMRMADEVDRGQAAGEIARKNQPVSQYVQGLDIPTFDELGISRQRVSEWREIRDAGSEVVEGAIHKALAEGRAPTKAEILEAAKEIRTELAAQRRAENEALKAATPRFVPIGRYETIVIDPPWDMQKIERDVCPNQVAFDYPTMTEEELAPISGYRSGA